MEVCAWQSLRLSRARAQPAVLFVTNGLNIGGAFKSGSGTTSGLICGGYSNRARILSYELFHVILSAFM